jgi:PAS domain S-box-containing protein
LENYRQFALPHELRACWSTPICSTSGAPLGTFALYARVARMPSAEEAQLPEIMSRTATPAIERKRDEAALRKSEEQFRSLSACSPVGIFLTDLEGEFTYTNPRCQTICGFTAQEAPGRGWARFVHPEDRAEIFESWSRHSLEGKDWSREIRFRNKAGATHWAHVRSTPMVSEAGARVGHLGMVEDITARSKFESALRESEDRLQLAIEAAELGTWDFLPLTGELNWSKRCKAIFGLPPDAEVDHPGFLALCILRIAAA